MRLILLLVALLSSLVAFAKSEKSPENGQQFSVVKKVLKPRHDGKHYFITENAPVGQPTTAQIDTAISEAQSHGRIITITSGGLSLSSAVKEIANLPVTFRSTINELTYDITVLSVSYTPYTAYLSMGCKFTPPKSTRSLYFGANSIKVSGKSGFIGALPILESILTANKSEELDDANALLSGETQFAEFMLPGFNNNLAIGLGKASQIEFSCGAFGNFNLSGFVKAYSIVEKESASGEILPKKNPLLLVFKDQVASDWKDLLLNAKVASAFHARNYPDLGFHFDKNQLAQIDLSNFRNPANLPTCAQTSAENWQGVAFPSFNVRLPRFFNLRSGNSLALGSGKNLFMDASGLIGNVSAETVFGLKEGYTDEVNKYDMSLDQLTATYSCNGQVTASLLGKIAIPWCGKGTSATTPLLRYSLRYSNNQYEIFVKDTDQGSFSSNKYTLSTGSKITFSIVNNQFTSTAELTEKPTLSTTAFSSSICRDFPATLNASQCSNKQLIWSTGDLGSSLTVKPTATTKYTVKCQDNYCVTSVSDSLKITVYESLPQPALTPGLSAFCRYEGTDLRADNCVGKIEWQLPRSSSFQQLGNDERVHNASFPNITQSTNYTYAVRCNLNGCLSPSMTKTITVNEEPASPQLYSNASNNTIDRNGSVTINGNCTNGNKLIWENLPQPTLSLASTNTYYAVCRNDATGCESLSKSKITINVLYFPPLAPSNLSVSASGTDFINLTWQDNSNNEDQFWLIRSADPSFSNHTTIGTLGPNTTSFHDNGLSEGITWYYQVIAHNRYDNGYSNVTSGNTLVRPGTPQLHAENTMITRGNSANVTASCSVGNLVWISPAGFTGGYRQQQDNVTYSARCVNSGIEGDIATLEVRVCDRPGAAISVNDLTITSGNTGQLTAQGCEGGTISWNTGSNQRTIDVNQAGYYTATCTVTNDCGTSSASDGGTVSVENRPCPLPTPSITVNDLSFKSGTTGTLSAYGCEGGSITWNTGFNGRNLSVSQAGYYIATCVITNECGSGSASDGGTVTITSCAPPATPWISVDDLTIDEKTNGSLTANGCDGGAIQWNTGSTDRSIGVSQAGYYTATCTVSNSCGSSSSSDGGIVTVRACTPPATPWISVDDISIDQNTSGTLRVNGCNEGTIRWNTGFTERYLPVNQAGYYTATCTVTNGCSSSSASDGGAVTIKNKPCNVDTPIISGPDEVEKGQQFTLSIANCTASSGRVTWSPSLSCVNVQLDAGCAMCGSIQSTTTFSAVTIGNGCVSAPAYKEVRVQDCPTPATPSITIDDAEIPAGQIGITVKVNGCENGKIQWNDGATENSRYISNAGTYSVTCRITNACGNTSEATDQAIVTRIPSCLTTPPSIKVNNQTTSNLVTINEGQIIEVSASCVLGGQLEWIKGTPGTYTINENMYFEAICKQGNNCIKGASLTININKCIPPAPILTGPSKAYKGTPITLRAEGCPSGSSYNWSPQDLIENNEQLGISENSTIIHSSTSFNVYCISSGCKGPQSTLYVSAEDLPPSTTSDWRFYSSGTCANGQGNLWRDYNSHSSTYRMTNCCAKYIVTCHDSNPSSISWIFYTKCNGELDAIAVYRRFYDIPGDPIEAREGSIRCSHCTISQVKN